MDDMVLEVDKVSKSFRAVRALHEVSLGIKRGEIVGLVGDNGAGKSTLVKICSGVHRADGGTVYLEGEPVDLTTPQHARELGIETLYQDLALVDELTVSGNVFLAREHLRAGWLGRLFGVLNKELMNKKTAESLEALQIDIPGFLKQPVRRLSGGQRQATAMVRAAFWGSKIMLLDEPTAALGVEQSERVLDSVRKIVTKGIAAVIISHNIHEVFSVSDHIIVLRQGEKVLDCMNDSTSPTDIVEYITGAQRETAQTS